MANIQTHSLPTLVFSFPPIIQTIHIMKIEKRDEKLYLILPQDVMNTYILGYSFPCFILYM